MDPNTQFVPATTPPTGESSAAKLKKTKRTLIIVGVVLALVIIATGFLGYRAYQGTTALNEKYSTGYNAGKADQGKADDAKIQEINRNPFRSFTAPKELGAFVVSFPRNWSLAVTKTTGEACSGYWQPDFVDTDSSAYALRISVTDDSYDSSLAKLRASVKSSKNKLTESTVEVSGVDGAKFSGLIDKKTTNGTVIILPLRDKTMVIQTDDNAKYGKDYDDIVTKLKINP